jgi:hypothetical protein
MGQGNRWYAVFVAKAEAIYCSPRGKSNDLKAAMPADQRRRIEAARPNWASRSSNSVRMSLADLRANRDVTQVDVAAALGVNQGAVSKIEGRDDLHVSTLQRGTGVLDERIEALDFDLRIVGHAARDAAWRGPVVSLPMLNRRTDPEMSWRLARTFHLVRVHSSRHGVV